MSIKTYEAYADTGRDYINFTFQSTHRANSKANKIDAEKAYKKKHGHGIYIISTCLVPENTELFY